MACGVPAGREAQTFFRVLGHKENHSLVKLQPRTGRTHQLRVHLAFIGHPILGDKIYAGKNVARTAPRQMLHSFQLKIFHPFLQKEMIFTAPPWDDFIEISRDFQLEEYLEKEANH